jgi:hypothetical protein
MDYELNYTNDDKNVPFLISALAFKHMARQSAVSKSALSWHQSTSSPLNSPAKVVVDKAGYAIANTDNLTDFGGGFRASTLAEAKVQYSMMVDKDPQMASKIQIVESFELAN